MRFKKKTLKLILFFLIGGCILLSTCISCVVINVKMLANKKKDELIIDTAAENFCKRFGNREYRNVYNNSLSKNLRKALTVEDLEVFEAEFFQCESIEVEKRKNMSSFLWTKNSSFNSKTLLEAKVNYFRDTSPGELKVEVIYEDGDYKIDDFEIEKYLTELEKQDIERLEKFN